MIEMKSLKTELIKEIGDNTLSPERFMEIIGKLTNFSEAAKQLSKACHNVSREKNKLDFHALKIYQYFMKLKPLLESTLGIEKGFCDHCVAEKKLTPAKFEDRNGGIHVIRLCRQCFIEQFNQDPLDYDHATIFNQERLTKRIEARTRR